MRTEGLPDGSSIYPCDQAEPEEQGTPDQEGDGQLNHDPALVTRKEKEEQTTQQCIETDAHEPAQPMLEGAPG